MGHSVEDVKIGLEVLFSNRLHHYDPYVPPCPFREEVYQNALAGRVRVGYFDSIDYVPTTVAMKRAFNIAKVALEQQGFELVPIKIPEADITEARDLFISLVVNFSLGKMIKLLDANYEAPLNCYKLSVMFFKANFFTRNLILSVLRLTGNKRIADAGKNIAPLSRDELDNRLKRQRDLTLRIKKEVWERHNIDAIL